jgi:site-specific recombinase XerD
MSRALRAVPDPTPTDAPAVAPALAWTLTRDEWLRNVRARNLSPLTVAGYAASLDQLATWATARGIDDPADVTATDLEAFQTWGLTRTTRRGKTASASSVVQAHRNLRVFFRWLAATDGIENPLATVAIPKTDDKAVDVFPLADLRALLDACKGRTFLDRRDTALVRMLLDTGVRARELESMTLDGLNLDDQLVTVMGKGRKIRTVPFGAKTAEAVGLYLRARAKHRDAADPALWLVSPASHHRGGIRREGMRDALDKRADVAGVVNVHPHRFRHTAADMFLSSDNVTEGDAMQRFGWSTRVMVDHYAASAAHKRSVAAYRKSSPADKV